MSSGLGGRLTIQLLEDTLDGAAAAAAGHGDVEFVVVFGHGSRRCWACRACSACSGRMGWVCEDWCKFENGDAMVMVWVLHRFDIFGQWQWRAYLLPVWMCKRREASGGTFGRCGRYRYTMILMDEVSNSFIMT